MFPREARLGSSRALLLVMRQGRAMRRGVLTVFSRSGPHTKAAVVVDKKVSKKAVVRNLVKRRLREIIKTLQPKNTELVARAYSGSENLSYKQLHELATQCLTSPQSARGRR